MHHIFFCSFSAWVLINQSGTPLHIIKAKFIVSWYTTKVRNDIHMTVGCQILVHILPTELKNMLTDKSLQVPSGTSWLIHRKKMSQLRIGRSLEESKPGNLTSWCIAGQYGFAYNRGLCACFMFWTHIPTLYFSQKFISKTISSLHDELKTIFSFHFQWFQ